MNTEQFNQVVEAILAGKYSWACVLILRFAGYNPLHYIPYRTYNRLIKENSRPHKDHKQPYDNQVYEESYADRSSQAASKGPSNQGSSKSSLGRIYDLNYLESIDNERPKVRGGSFTQWLNLKLKTRIHPSLR